MRKRFGCSNQLLTKLLVNALPFVEWATPAKDLSVRTSVSELLLRPRDFVSAGRLLQRCTLVLMRKSCGPLNAELLVCGCGECLADWKSAIRQIGNLRYEGAAR